MVNKSVQDKNPIMWSCLERPYIERYMENESSHPCGGIFVFNFNLYFYEITL